MIIVFITFNVLLLFCSNKYIINNFSFHNSSIMIIAHIEILMKSLCLNASRFTVQTVDLIICIGITVPG